MGCSPRFHEGIKRDQKKKKKKADKESEFREALMNIKGVIKIKGDGERLRCNGTREGYKKTTSSTNLAIKSCCQKAKSWQEKQK